MEPFLVADGIRSGLSRESLRSSYWQAPFYGIRAVSGSLRSVEDVCTAYALKLRPGSVFAGVTAARLWGMPLPAYIGREIGVVQVSAEDPRRAPRGVGVRGSRHHRGTSTTRIGSLPVLSAAETWRSLWRDLDRCDLTAVADHLLSDRTGPPMSTLDALGDLVRDHRHGPGIEKLRAALADARAGSWSRPETLVRLVLCSAGVPEPELNLAIAPGGRSPRVDLAWPTVRFGLEYDGDQHRSPAEFSADIRRQERVQDRGWSLMRVTRSDLFDRPAELVDRVHRRLAERGWAGIRVRGSQMVVVRR